MNPLTLSSPLLLVPVLFALCCVAILLLARMRQPRVALRAVIGGLTGLNGLGLLASIALGLYALGVPMPVLAQGTEAAAAAASGNTALGAALSTGLACIGAGISVGIAGAAAIGAITEKPEVLGKSLIFVGLAEGIAIYGLIISFMILNG